MKFRKQTVPTVIHPIQVIDTKQQHSGRRGKHNDKTKLQGKKKERKKLQVFYTPDCQQLRQTDREIGIRIHPTVNRELLVNILKSWHVLFTTLAGMVDEDELFKIQNLNVILMNKAKPLDTQNYPGEVNQISCKA